MLSAVIQIPVKGFFLVEMQLGQGVQAYQLVLDVIRARARCRPVEILAHAGKKMDEAEDFPVGMAQQAWVQPST